MAVVEIVEEYAYQETLKKPDRVIALSACVFLIESEVEPNQLRLSPKQSRIFNRLLEDANNGHHGVLEDDLDLIADAKGAKRLTGSARDLFFDLRGDGWDLLVRTTLIDDKGTKSYRQRLEFAVDKKNDPIKPSPDIEPPRFHISQPIEIHRVVENLPTVSKTQKPKPLRRPRPEVEQVEPSDEEKVANFDTIYNEHQRHIFNYLYRMLGNPEDALDLTQETFLRAYQALPNYSDEGKVKPWLFRIATNACLDELRRRNVIRWQPWESFMSVFHPKQVARDDPEDDLISKERAEIVSQVLDKLPPRYRLCLLLREYEELSCEEMSEILGTTRGAVKSLLFRARDEFREIYKAINENVPPTPIAQVLRERTSVAQRRSYNAIS